MRSAAAQGTTRRYRGVDAEKAHGATYTPDSLARFIAERLVESADLEDRESITILDPAIGDGALVLALLDALDSKSGATLSVRGFDVNIAALDESARRIRAAYPNAQLELTRGNSVSATASWTPRMTIEMSGGWRRNPAMNGWLQ